MGEGEIVYGKNPVECLLKSSSAIDVLYISTGLNEKVAAYYTALCKEKGAVTKRVPTQKLDTLCEGGVHQGVVVALAQIEYLSMADVIDMADGQQRINIVIIDDIQDPYNLGAIIRSAYLTGATAIVLSKRGSSGVTPTVVKASAGTARLMPVARVSNIGEVIRRLKSCNVFVYGADSGGTDFNTVNFCTKTALVMGGEGSGISPMIKKMCDVLVAIPQKNSGVIDSYNVSVAAGILLYHISGLGIVTK